MTPVECPQEPELLVAIQSGRWPARADQSLVTHVRACVVCGDVALVAPAILNDAHQGFVVDGSAVSVPDAGAVWLRAKWRARAEDERRATHPITAAQAAAIAVVAATAGALVGASSSWLQGQLASTAVDVATLLPSTAVVSVIAAKVAAHAALAATALLAVVAAPVAAYLVTRD